MIQRFLELFRPKIKWYEKQFVWIVLGGAAIAVLISLAIGLMQSVWFDEAYSILLAKRPVGELIYLTSIDTHPPFYYLLLKLWGSVFGWSEFALRSVSVLAMGGAIIVGAFLVKRLFGVKAALVTLPLLVLAPFLLRYGFEIRMYSLASLIGVTATYVLVSALNTKGHARKVWLYAAYAVLVALGVFTLYYTVLLWVTHVAWLIWRSIRRKEDVFKQPWWLAYLGSILLFLPWLPTFLKQITNGALAPISQQLTIDNMAGIVSFWFFSQPAWMLNGLMSLAILAVIVTLVYVIICALKALPSNLKEQYGLLVWYAGAPILLIALISLARPMYVERYLAHVLIGFGLLLGVSIWLMWQKKPKAASRAYFLLIAALVIGVGFLTTAGNYNYQRVQHPQIKEAANTLPCDKTKPILANDPYVAIELSYYLTNCDVHFYSDTAELKGGYAPLSGSMLRVEDPSYTFKDAKMLMYVYYDKPALTLPGSLKTTNDTSFGSLHVTTFTAE